MKRLGILMVLLLLVPSVAASTFFGWTTIPGEMTFNGYAVRFADVSMDGSVFVEMSNGTSSEGFKLFPGDSASFGQITVTLNRTFVGKSGHILAKVSFPYVLEGEGVIFDRYNLTLLYANEKGFKVRITDGNTTKEFSSKDFTFGDLKIHVEAYPKVFDGYLERGKSVEYFGHTITFENATVENITDYIEKVVLKVDGTPYELNVGDKLDTREFHIVTSDLKGIDYLKLSVNLRGAYIDVLSNPYFEDYVYEGKDVKIGPYLVRVDRILGNQAYVSIRNECGVEVAGGLVDIGGSPVTGIAHGGVEVGVEGVSTDSNGIKAKLIVFFNPAEVPKAEEFPWLDVTLKSPSNALQYVPFNTTIFIRNNGNEELKNLRISYEAPKDVEILSLPGQFIEKLGPRKSVSFKLPLRINSTGKVEIGRVVVKADVPYELACSGYTTLSFYSNSPRVEVAPADALYSLSISVPGRAPLGEPLQGTLKVHNAGNVELPVVIEVPLSGRFALLTSDMAFEGGYLRLEESLPVNATEEHHFTLVPMAPGNVSLGARVLFQGKVLTSTSSVVEVLPRQPEVVYVNLTDNKTCEPKVVYVNVTEPCNCTTITETKIMTTTVPQVVEVPKIVKENVTVEVVPLKGKLTWMGIGVLVGAGAIILLAWYQAQRG
ncbi:hypothetical protein [Palaeococcus ferrophilus]|uniref:hypothetical protein n=1 Tax=Palaeococcus ferrophilus TaxID=83868 RepID=UPI0012F9BC9E|nr:hypothetical protein [Palaeococcus ferrophilus]